MRVGGHFQALRAPYSQNLSDAVDQCRGNAAPHPGRVYEEVFQFDGAVGLDPGGEANQRAVLFRDMSAASASPSGPRIRYSG